MTDLLPGPALDRLVSDDLPTRLWNDSADPDELRRSIALGAVGATCNPVIALAVVRRHLGRWSERIREIASEDASATDADIAWQVVEELSIEGAGQLEPAFEASGGRDGRLSIQTDPRLHRDSAALVDQAVRFAGLAPNVIVKIPATAVGIAAMEEATFRGVSINATVSFTVAQAVAAAEAIERGLDRRAAEGLPEHEFGSVVTIMGGRLDDWLKHTTKRDRVLVDPGILEWAGVAALKKAYSIFQARAFRSRVLSAAFRNHFQWSELQGGDLVVSPPFDWQLRIAENRLPVVDRIDVPVDPAIVEELLRRVPDFARAYDEHGLSLDEFDSFGASVITLRQFLEAGAELEALVREVILEP
ncbi:transaldolase family protein [Herbiconiux sp. UC225_62]|uniref:transaldolase family protein n=1 Tax=Herbiconiux sp. UC225_62 TaxID=3350168 RepID=UPI0036D34360